MSFLDPRPLSPQNSFGAKLTNHNYPVDRSTDAPAPFVRKQRYNVGNVARVNNPARSFHGMLVQVDEAHLDPFPSSTGATGRSARYIAAVIPDNIGVPEERVEVYDWELVNL